jgi:hypothetical protein
MNTNQIEKERAGNDTPAEPVPPIKTTATAPEIEHLRLDASEAVALVNRLRGLQQDCLRQYNELQDKIAEAQEASDKAMEAYHSVKPKKLPKEWTHDQMAVAARKQCPGRDETEIKRLVGLIGASQRGALAGEGLNKPLPPIEGNQVRELDNHKYNIPAPPREPRETKKYG